MLAFHSRFDGGLAHAFLETSEDQILGWILYKQADYRIDIMIGVADSVHDLDLFILELHVHPKHFFALGIDNEFQHVIRTKMVHRRHFCHVLFFPKSFRRFDGSSTSQSLLFLLLLSHSFLLFLSLFLHLDLVVLHFFFDLIHPLFDFCASCVQVLSFSLITLLLLLLLQPLLLFDQLLLFELQLITNLVL